MSEHLGGTGGHAHPIHDDWMTIDCPDCGAVAEVTPYAELGSTSGRVAHVTIRCVFRHWFLLPAELMVTNSTELF